MPIVGSPDTQNPLKNYEKSTSGPSGCRRTSFWRPGGVREGGAPSKTTKNRRKTSPTCTTRYETARHIMKLHNTLWNCTTHYETAQHITKQHNTLWNCATHYETAQHIMKLRNTLWNCATHVWSRKTADVWSLKTANILKKTCPPETHKIPPK